MNNIPKILERAISNLKREGLISYLRSFNISYKLFAVHEFWVSILYGKTGDYFVFNISDSLRDSLISFFLEQEFANYKDCGSDEENLLMFNSLSYETRLKLDECVRVWDFNSKNAFFDKLQQELRDSIKSFVKSPFCFVNARAWKTLPNSELFGPNSLHTDGFYPGHLKVMLYLTPLSKESGALQVGQELIIDKPAGTAVIFKNSDVRHSGIPGKSEERISIEITIFRSFIYQFQFHNGHYNGRHYKSVFTPYLKYFKNNLGLT
jgi:hypothetical protein